MRSKCAVQFLARHLVAKETWCHRVCVYAYTYVCVCMRVRENARVTINSSVTRRRQDGADVKNFGRPVMRRVHKRTALSRRTATVICSWIHGHLFEHGPWALGFCCPPSKQHRAALTTRATLYMDRITRHHRASTFNGMFFWQISSR